MYKFIFLLLLTTSAACSSTQVYQFPSGSLLANSDKTDSATIKYDSLSITAIKPGYYYKRIPVDTADNMNYNEIDWICVTPDNQVRLFVTASFEYCMYEMYWKNEPKEIYRQLKKNTSKFNELYLKCENQEFVASRIKKNNDAIIVLNPAEGDLIDQDELLFVKGGLIRKIRNYERIISMDEYHFIGK